MNRNWTYFLFFLLSVFTYGQVEITLKTDKKDYSAKEVIQLNIVLEFNANEYEQQTGFQLPDLSNFNVIAAKSISNAISQPDNQDIIVQKITKIALEPKKKGKIKIGSVLVTVSDKIYKTEPFYIFVNDIEKKATMSNNASNEVFLNMEVKEKSVYINQPVKVVLMGYSKNMDRLRNIKNIVLPKNNQFTINAVDFSQSAIDPEGIDEMPSQVLATFLVSPTHAGLLEIPSVSALVASHSFKEIISSNKEKLEIKELPKGAPKNYNNAIGDFKVAIKLPSDSLKFEINKPIEVSVKLSGEGNFSPQILPKIATSKNYVVYPPKLTSSLIPTDKGWKGEMIAHYILVPNILGKFPITTEEYAFFEPSLKIYKKIPKKTIQVKIFSEEEIDKNLSTVEKVNDYTNTILKTVESPNLPTNSLIIKEKQKINWRSYFWNSLLLFGFIMAFLGYKKWKRKSIYTKKEDQNNLKNEVETIAEAERKIKANQTIDFEVYENYLNSLISKQNDALFYTTLEELETELINLKGNPSTHSFLEYLENHQNKSLISSYKELINQIQIQKYNPNKKLEEKIELLNKAISIYREIAK